jgi:hypothetical protein
MNSSPLITGQSLVVFALAVVILVFLMRRTFLRDRKPGRGQPSLPGSADAATVENSAEAAVEKLEVRIFDFAREVEARLQTRIAVLDRLIVDADREILRLQDLLEATKGTGGTGPPGGPVADQRTSELPTGRRMPGRQPDAVLPGPRPAQASKREAA